MRFQERPKTDACSNKAIAPTLAIPFSSPVSPLGGSVISSEKKKNLHPKELVSTALLCQLFRVIL